MFVLAREMASLIELSLISRGGIRAEYRVADDKASARDIYGISSAT